MVWDYCIGYYMNCFASHGANTVYPISSKNFISVLLGYLYNRHIGVLYIGL